MFGAAAATHIEAIDGASGFERGLGQATRITRGAGAFESMHQNQLRHRLALRHLRMHQHLNARLSVVELGGNGKARFVQIAMPVIARDGEQVRIAKEWDERPQQTILMRQAADYPDASGKSLAQANRVRPTANSDPQRGVARARFYLDRNPRLQSQPGHLA